MRSRETTLSPLVSRWPECRRVLSVEPIDPPGFSGADVFRVRTDAGEFALRRWPANSLPVARVRELHRFLGFLKQCGIEFVAVPRPDLAGETVVFFEGRRWQLEPWMPGTAVAQHPPVTELAGVMRALARLHVAAARYEPTEPGRQWFFRDPARESPAVIERLRLIREWGEGRVRVVSAGCNRIQRFPAELPQLYVRLAPMIAAELQSCASVKVHVHPCLRDVHREHVLVSGRHVTGIIDPSAARSENVASDLSRLLGSLLGSGPWERALDAYSKVRPLSDDERRLAAVLDRSGVLLSALTWLQRVPGGEFSPWALQRIHEIHERLQAIAESEGGPGGTIR